MRYRAILAATAATLTGLATMAGATTAGAAAPSPAGQLHSAKVCAAPTAGTAACMSMVRTDASGKPIATLTPGGFGPAAIQSAYKLAGLSSAGRTVAIVDAYDDPTAEADLGVYRAQFGLSACTTANGCFRKINQTGGTKYPRTNSGWAQEVSLDLDMVSATCPDCRILLVEANSNSFANLGAAVITAAGIAGVSAISNSYGGGDAADTTYGAYYNHPGIAVTASSGDSGYGASYPASSSYVTAVGGTHLVTAANTRGWTETVWSGAGAGCSSYNTALPGGWSSVAPARQLRSSARSTRCPATRPGTRTPCRTATPRPSLTSPLDLTAPAPRPSGAPPESAGMDRPAWEPPTAWAHSDLALTRTKTRSHVRPGLRCGRCLQCSQPGTD